MARKIYSSDVTRERFETVRELLESTRRKTRPRKYDSYDVFRAVLYYLNSEDGWRAMPAEFPPWRTVHETFTHWTKLPENNRSVLASALDRLGLAPEAARLNQLKNDRLSKKATDI